MISINNYTDASACMSEQKNSYCEPLTNKRHKGVKAKLGKQTIGNTSQQEKKHSVVPSRVIKHLIQIKTFKQRCNTVLLPQPRKRNIYIWPQSQHSTLSTCALLGILVSLGKMKFGLISMFIFHVILDPWWFLPAADWQGALQRTCFTTKVWILAF